MNVLENIPGMMTVPLIPVWGPPVTVDDRFRETACQTISTFVDHDENVEVKGYAPSPEVAHFTQ
jgi:hypothetical protein